MGIFSPTGKSFKEMRRKNRMKVKCHNEKYLKKKACMRRQDTEHDVIVFETIDKLNKRILVLRTLNALSKISNLHHRFQCSAKLVGCTPTSTEV